MSRMLSTEDVFHAVADKNRRALLDFLAAGEAPVSSLVDHAGLSYSAVSQHLAVLLEVGLVRRRQNGRQRIYRLEPGALREVHDWTATYEKFWRSKISKLKDVLKGRK
ncbi:MAG: metalloregulator ArsR/SmtB family transcription factor [Polyangiaceae bacterium]